MQTGCDLWCKCTVLLFVLNLPLHSVKNTIYTLCTALHVRIAVCLLFF